MKGTWQIAVLCCGAALVGGCTNLVNITSRPTGARVRIDGVERGRTPIETRVTWWPWRYNRITLEHPGYHPFSTVLRRTFRFPDPPDWWQESDPWKFLVVYLGIPTLYIGFAPFRGPVNNQRFVLAPRLRGPRSEAPPPEGAMPAPPVRRPVPPEWRFSVGLGAGVYASDPTGDYVGRGSLEARKGRHAVIVSSGDKIVDIEEPDHCELHHRVRLVYRAYAGAERRASEWFWEAGLAVFNLLASAESGGPSWEGEAAHFAAGIGMRVRWSQGRPAWFSEIHLSLSAGEELGAPSGFVYSGELDLESPHVELGAVVIGVSF